MKNLFIKFIKSSRLRWVLILAAVAAFVVWSGYTGFQEHQIYVYTDHLDEAAAWVDGDAITLRDLSYYVLLEECIIEKEARIYNPKSSKDYWNIRDDGYIMSAVVRRTIREMGVHDHIFYQKALEEGIELTPEEEAYLENEIQDFWMDLLDEQLERLPTNRETINEEIRRKALAEKYQAKLASEMGIAGVRLSWDGYDYKKLLMAEHQYKKNNKIWNRIRISEVTIHHDKVNFINGHNLGDDSSEDEEIKAIPDEENWIDRMNIRSVFE